MPSGLPPSYTPTKWLPDLSYPSMGTPFLMAISSPEPSSYRHEGLLSQSWLTPRRKVHRNANWTCCNRLPAYLPTPWSKHDVGLNYAEEDLHVLARVLCSPMFGWYMSITHLHLVDSCEVSTWRAHSRPNFLLVPSFNLPTQNGVGECGTNLSSPDVRFFATGMGW